MDRERVRKRGNLWELSPEVVVGGSGRGGGSGGGGGGGGSGIREMNGW